MGYHLRPSGSDTILEAEGADPASVLVEIARAFTHVTTNGDRVAATETAALDVSTPGDPARLLVAYVDELVYLFGTRGFLPAEGDLSVTLEPGRGRVVGALRGQRYDPARHRLGTEVKAATLHGARFERTPQGATARVLVDL